MQTQHCCALEAGCVHVMDMRLSQVQVHSAYLSRISTTREEVAIIIAMQRDVQNTGVFVESLLGAVTMVNILDIDWMTS